MLGMPHVSIAREFLSILRRSCCTPAVCAFRESFASVVTYLWLVLATFCRVMLCSPFDALEVILEDLFGGFEPI